jgi:leader peptidase (prepilin peptidase)/N-methyltransferase
VSVDVAAAAVCGVVGLGTGYLVPALIGRIPELPPAPAAAAEARAAVAAGERPPEPPMPFADVARLPGLAWKAALASGVCAALVGLSLGWIWPLVFLVPLVPISVALAVVDWCTRILPTWLIAPTYLLTVALVLVAWVGAGLQYDFVPRFLLHALIGWVLAGGLYFLLWFVYPRGMGYGDVRLSGILGIALGYLGWSQLVVGIYGGFLLGGVLGGLLSVLRRVDRKGYPFGPFMLLGALVGVVVGQPIIDAWVN